MKVWVCQTGWQEGSRVHAIFDSQEKAEKWYKEMTEVILPEKDRLSEHWSQFGLNDPKNMEAYKKVEELCDKHNIDLLDHWASIEDVEVQ